MKFLSSLFLNPLTLIALFNLLGLIVIWQVKKSQVRWNYLFQLLIIDAAALYVVLSGVLPQKMSIAAWAGVLMLFLYPFLLYRLTVAFISFFLLPIELKHWRQWIQPAQALIGFARGANFPFYAYDEKTDRLEKRIDGNIIAKKAGLGIILQRPEHAVVLHNGAVVTRVADGDIVFTKRLERVLELVDLRHHILMMPGVKAITKDGISVKLTLFVPCRIDRTGIPSSSERLYPFNPNAVFKAVCEENIAEDGKQSWYKLTIQKARRATCDVISTYTLDRLLIAEEPEQIPRREIREHIKNRLTAEMVGSGVEIIGVGFANIEPDDPLDGQRRGTDQEEGLINVATQRINSWQVKWQRRASVRRAEGEAEAIRILEQARAKALIELINAVEEGFREMASHDNGAQPGDIIALSFVSAIEQMLSQQNFPKPLEIFDTQSTLQEIRQLMLSPAYEQKKG